MIFYPVVIYKLLFITVRYKIVKTTYSKLKQAIVGYSKGKITEKSMENFNLASHVTSIGLKLAIVYFNLALGTAPYTVIFISYVCYSPL